MKLAGGGCPPVPEMQEFGMNVSLGTDGPASNNSHSMFEAMKFCSLLVKNSRWDATAAKDSDVFSFATLGGARALGIPAGELKEGKLADIVLLDLKAPNMAPHNSHAASLAYSAHPGNVTDSVIDGKIVMRDGEITAFDEEKAVENAGKEAEKLAR